MEKKTFDICFEVLSRFEKEGMELLGRHGVSKVARVIPDPGRDIGFNILSIFHYSRSVKIHTCPTREEADQCFSGR